MRVGNAGHGSTYHIASVALEDKASVSFNNVPFQGGNVSVTALLGGHIDAVVATTAEVAQYVIAGKLRALAVMSNQRIKVPGFQDVPTFKEHGLDLTLGTWRGVAAPKGTPQPILDTLTSALSLAAADPKFKNMMEQQSLGYAVADSKSFDALVLQDSAKHKELIEKFGLRSKE